MSEKQITANRENAKKSTGPKTEEGKRKSSQNAVTHGLSAQKLVFNNKASRKRFDSLLAGLKTHFSPSNFYQERLVEQLAIEEWKLSLCNQQELRELQNRSRATVAHIVEYLPQTSALHAYYMDWGIPGPWDCDSVVVKTTDLEQKQDADERRRSNDKQGVGIEARLSDPLPKVARYTRATWKRRDKILDQLLQWKGMQKD